MSDPQGYLMGEAPAPARARGVGYKFCALNGIKTVRAKFRYLEVKQRVCFSAQKSEARFNADGRGAGRPNTDHRIESRR